MNTVEFVGKSDDKIQVWLVLYEIMVNQEYKVIVCIECGGIAHFHNIVPHKKRSHFLKSTFTLPETQLPSSEKIQAAIAALGGLDPCPPNPSDGPFAPIAGVEIVSN